MKIKFSYTYFLLWVILILWINYKTFLWSTVKSTNNSSTSIYKVELWDIKNSIEVVWNSELVDEQSLSFNKEWTITRVNFKAWDNVKKWDIIAEIDNSDAYNNIDDAKLNLENAKINLNDLYDWAEEVQILQAKNNISTSEFNLQIAKKQLENLIVIQKNTLDKLIQDIDNSKKDLETSESNLELSKKELEVQKKQIDNSLDTTVINKNSTIQNIEDSFRWNLAEAQKIVQDWDYILWITPENRDKNDEYEVYLWAKDSVSKTNASNTLSSAIAIYNKLKIELDNYIYDWDKEEITNLLNNFLDLYNKLYESSDFTYKTVDSSIQSVWSLTDSQISTMKSTMSSNRSSSLVKVTSIKSQINSLKTLTDTDLISQGNDNTISLKEESIKSQELSIEKNKQNIKESVKNYDETVLSQKIALESSQNDVDSKKNSLEIAKMNLEDLLEWPTDSNIKKAQNSIKQAQIKLDTANENLSDYNLIAPFDWVLRKIDYMVWDNLTNDAWKYVYIENPNLLEITVMLDQIDIVSVKQWSNTIVTFDAYPTIPVNAKISTIDTTPIQTNWVVSYEVKIVLDDLDFDKNVLSWMTANIEIITQMKQNVTLVKTSAISEKNGKKYVIIQNNLNELEIEVEIWITSWWLTEIISWLKEGDTVVIREIVTNSNDTTKISNSTSLFSVPWWWWSSWFRPRD